MADKQGITARITALIAWVQSLKPVRVFTLYTGKRGPLLAAGLSYQSIFAVFAGLWVGFAVVGLVLRSQPDLQNAVFDMIGTYVPGLFDSGGSKGAINPHDLLEARTLSWTGAIALVGLLFTALGWLASCRDAVRVMFELPGEKLNFLLLKLKDLGLAIAFGVALIVSATLSIFSTQALGAAFDLLGIDQHSVAAEIVGRVVGLLLMLILDTAVLAALFRLLSGLAIPLKQLLVGSLIGAVGLGVLKVLGSSLLGGASKNPLLASFAVIIGLLIWFNFICQVILLSGAWIAESVADRDIVLDPVAEAARLERERADLAEAQADAEAAARKRPWFVRLFRRHPHRGHSAS
ncbi:YihY/virulence factor BrkB family protein [Parafrigoribacterium soli]|uniref:YihY/virulence factor BrkB family protein n=1 Tax=Parafrigoribacterium soli TaxID=3144663 RepID=UPI0032F0429E